MASSLVAIMIHQQKMNYVWLSQKVKPALPHFLRKGHLHLASAAVRDREGSLEQGWGAALSGLRDWQMCCSFLWPCRAKVAFLPSILPHPTPPTVVASGLSLLLGILVFPRLPPVYRKSLRTDWRLPGCFFPPACFLCRSYSESLGLGCCWGTHRQVFLDGNQCLFTNCQGTSGRNWRGVGRKKKPKHQGEKKGQNKNLFHLTILQTGLPRISPVKHILRSKCHLP